MSSVSALRAIVDDLKEIIAKLNMSVAELNEAIKESRIRKSELIRQLLELKEDLKNRPRITMEEHKLALASSEERLREIFNSEVNNLKNEVIASQQATCWYQNQYSILYANYISMEALGTQYAQQLTELSSLTNQVSAYNCQISNFENKLADKDVYLGELTGKVRNLEVTCSIADAKVKEAESRVLELDSQLNQASQQSESYCCNLTLALTRIEELEAQRVDENDLYHKLQVKFDQLTESNLSAASKLADSELRNSNYLIEIDKLTALWQEKDHAIMNMHQKVESNQLQLQQWNVVGQNYEANFSALMQQYNELLLKLSTYQEQTNWQVADYAKQINELSTKCTGLAGAQDENQSLRSQLTDQACQLTDLQLRLQEKDKVIIAMQAQLRSQEEGWNAKQRQWDKLALSQDIDILELQLLVPLEEHPSLPE